MRRNYGLKSSCRRACVARSPGAPGTGVTGGKSPSSHGDFRTKLVILDIYDRLQEAIDTGEPYQTTLDPPPAAASLAQPAGQDDER